MGAYSPAPVLTAALEERVMDEIIRPTVRAMADADMPYSGVLYAGLMLTAQGPKLIEYNARFGDPECQVLMMRLESDLVDLLLATAQGRLAALGSVTLSDKAALTVVMAANGYPGAPDKGGAISGIAPAEGNGTRVLHAGTAVRGGQLVANGGRVLNVTAPGSNVTQAQASPYAAVDAPAFPSALCPPDLGSRAVARAATT